MKRSNSEFTIRGPITLKFKVGWKVCHILQSSVATYYQEKGESYATQKC